MTTETTTGPAPSTATTGTPTTTPVEVGASDPHAPPSPVPPEPEFRVLPARHLVIKGGFFKRFTARLDRALAFHERIVIAAAPGDGKTTTAELWAVGHGGIKRPGKTTVRILMVALPKGPSVNHRTFRWAVDAALGVVLEADDTSPTGEDKDDAHKVAVKLLDAKVEQLIVDDVQSCDIEAFNVIRGVIDIFDAFQRPLSVVLLMAQVTPRPKDSAPWPLLSGQDPDAWQMWRRLTAPRRPIPILGHDKDEIGVVLTTYEKHYADVVHRSNLHRWLGDIFEGLTSPRVDRLLTRRASIDSIRYVALESLKHAYEARRHVVSEGSIRGALNDLRRD